MKHEISIIIDFDEDSKQKLWQLSQGLDRLKNFKPFWMERGGVVDLIRRDIKINIEQGIDPDLRTWALLSPTYRRQVHGRQRMELGSTAMMAYALAVEPKMDHSFLIFEPNWEKMAEHPHYEALRRGWVSATGGVAPPREWFGIHPWTKREINEKLDAYVQSAMARAVSRGMGALRGRR